MPFQIKLDPDFKGPTLIELETIIHDTKGVIEILWENTKLEFLTLARYSKRDFILHVKDCQTLDKVANVLGIKLPIDKNVIDNAKESLGSRRNYNWRPLVQGSGSTIGKSTVLRIASDALRNGKSSILASIASDCLFKNVNPIDADVFLRLKAMR